MNNYNTLKRQLRKYYRLAHSLTTQERVKLYVSMGIAKIPVSTADRKRARIEILGNRGRSIIPSQKELGR